MKFKLSVYALLFLIITGCRRETTIMNFDNETESRIEKCRISIQGKEFPAISLQAKEKQKVKVDKRDIPSQVHDFRIEVSYELDGKPVNGFFYTDLSGAPGSSYIIKLSKDRATILSN
jgi:hypothetical protein